MSAEDRLPSVDKLSDTNWPIWKLQIKTYFDARELWRLCTGEEVEPVAPGADGDYDAYAQQLAKYNVWVARVKSILLQMVLTSQLHVIAQQHLNSPHEMWNELVQTFERPSLTNKLQLQTRLLDIAMEPGSSVDMYFKQLQDLTERLAALGAPVEPDFQVALLLRGLPSEYDALRVAFVAKGTVTMSELHEALSTEECRLNLDAGLVGATSSSVLAAHGNNKSRNRGKQMNAPGPCFGCGCSATFAVTVQQSRMFNSLVNRKVNLLRNIKQNKQSIVRILSVVVMMNMMMKLTILCLQHCMVLVYASLNKWIIDSGATKHMTPCLNMFVEYVPFCVNESVSLGNGTVCDAVGIGRVAVDMLCDGTVKHYTLSDVLYVPRLVNNSFSVTAATLKGHEVTFKQKQCRIQRNGQLTATGHCTNNVWYIDSVSALDNVCCKLNSGSDINDVKLWHQHLGHVHEK